MRQALDPSVARVVEELLHCVNHVVFWDVDKSFADMIAEQETERASVNEEHIVWNERLRDIGDKVSTMKTVLAKAIGERKAWQANLFALSEERKDLENEEGNLLEELQQRRIKTRAMILELDGLESRLEAFKTDLEAELEEEKDLNDQINSIVQEHQAMKKYYQELHGTESGRLDSRVPDAVYDRAVQELEGLQERLDRFEQLESNFTRGIDLKKIRLDQVKENLEAAKRVRIAFDRRVPVRERPENRAMTPRPDWSAILQEQLPCLNKTLRNHPAYAAKVGGVATKEAQAVKQAADAFRRGRRRRPMRLKRSNSIDSEPFTFAASRKMVELLLSIKDAQTNGSAVAPGTMLAMLQNQINNVQANLESTRKALRDAEHCIPADSEYFAGRLAKLSADEPAAVDAEARPQRSARRASISVGDIAQLGMGGTRKSLGNHASMRIRRGGQDMASLLASLREEQAASVSKDQGGTDQAGDQGASPTSSGGHRGSLKYMSMGISRKRSTKDEASYTDLAQRARKAIARRRGESSAAISGKNAVVDSVLKLMQNEKRKLGPNPAAEFATSKAPPFTPSQLLDTPFAVTLVDDAPTFVVCLGTDSKVPRFLRTNGKVQYRVIKTDEVSSLLDDLLDERSGDLQLHDKSFDELVYHLLRKRYGAQSVMFEWAYNLFRELYELQDAWALARVIFLILAGEVGESFLTLENYLLLEIHSFFKRIDVDTQKEISGSPAPVGYVCGADVIESLHAFAPRARPSELSQWEACLERDLQGSEGCNYTRALFAEPRKSTFIQSILLHVVGHLRQYMKSLVAAIEGLEKVATDAKSDETDDEAAPGEQKDTQRRRQSSTSANSDNTERVVPLRIIKTAIVKVDAGLEDEEIAKWIAQVQGCKPKKIAWDQPVNPTTFAKRFRRLVVPFPSRPILNADADVSVSAATAQDFASIAIVKRRTHTLIRKSTSKRASFLDIKTSLASSATLNEKYGLTRQATSTFQPRRPTRLKSSRSKKFGNMGKSGRIKPRSMIRSENSFSVSTKQRQGKSSALNISQMPTLTESLVHEISLPTLTESIVAQSSRGTGSGEDDSDDSDGI